METVRTSRRREPIEHEIYDGRHRLGSVQSVADQFEASDGDGRSLGRFNTESAAAAAVVAAARSFR